QSHSALCFFLAYNNLPKRYTTQILTVVIKHPLNFSISHASTALARTGPSEKLHRLVAESEFFD
ncbi:MAG: hypothetical protein K2H08_09160, partial [Duncaniella sp.]|nr:hypothetical protein [Duncaniella sp.]